MWTNDEQQCRAREQAKMSQLEDQSDKLDKALAGMTAPPR